VLTRIGHLQKRDAIHPRIKGKQWKKESQTQVENEDAFPLAGSGVNTGGGSPLKASSYEKRFEKV